MKRIGSLRSLVNWRPIRYEMNTVLCKQKTTPISNQSDVKLKTVSRKRGPSPRHKAQVVGLKL